ncbi:MAG: IPT/TIG domain-containing protein, partial [Mycobacteriales bacterium]
VIGFRSTSVDATATASVRGVASSLPYYVTPDVGPQQCWLRKTENDATPVRAALLAQPASPTISGIDPTSGPERTATRVTITGTGFDPSSGATDVLFNNRTPAQVVSVTATEIVAETPLLPAGVARVVVTTPAGASNTVDFTFTAQTAPAPTLTTVSPGSGPELTGTAFTLTGNGFVGTNIQVEFGGTPATGVVVTSRGTLTGVTPASVPAGAVAVHLFADGIPSGNTVPFTFTPAALGPPPVVTSIAPTSGPEAGGTVLTVRGTDFAGVPAVYFGGVVAPTTVVSPQELTAVAPAGVGVVDVTVVADGGTSAVFPGDRFTYVPAPLDICGGESGQRGYVDVPRADGGGMVGNIARGLDHALLAYGAVPSGFPTCAGLPGAVAGTNCLETDERVSGETLRKGFFDPGGRMRRVLGGADRVGSIGPFDDVDIDTLADFVDPSFGTVNDLIAAFNDPARTPIPGWLRPEIALCPRFSVVPVLNVPPSGPRPNKTYPIVGFKGLFIDDVPDATTDRGFVLPGASGNVKGMAGWVFDLGYVAGVLPAGDFPTVDYVGGPKVIALVE